MKKHELKVSKRTVLGKKVKKLRKEGIFPANIYGKELKSTAIQLPFKDFEKVFKEAGETGLVDVTVDGQVRPSLIHNVQYDPLSHTPLHADFYQVNLKEKVKTMVPIVTAGEPKAVSDKVGLLLQQLSEVEVEALPTDLPEKIEVDVSPLAAVDEQITVAELKIPTGVTLLSDPNQVVVKIGELVTKEAKEEAAAEAAAAEAAKAAAAEEAGAPEEGAPAAEGAAEQPAEGEKPQEASKPDETEKPQQ